MQKRTSFPSFCCYKIASILLKAVNAYTSVITDCFRWLSYHFSDFGIFPCFMLYIRFNLG